MSNPNVPKGSEAVRVLPLRPPVEEEVLAVGVVERVEPVEQEWAA